MDIEVYTSDPDNVSPSGVHRGRDSHPGVAGKEAVMNARGDNLRAYREQKQREGEEHRRAQEQRAEGLKAELEEATSLTGLYYNSAIGGFMLRLDDAEEWLDRHTRCQVCGLGPSSYLHYTSTLSDAHDYRKPEVTP